MSWYLTATIYYWPGSYPEQDVKEIQIDEVTKFFSRHDAVEELDQLIREKVVKLEHKGFETQYDHWKVETVE